MPPGVAARRLAWATIAEVLARRAALDEVFEAGAAKAGLDERDTALARAIAVAGFRRFGTIRAALAERLARGLPRDQRLLALLVTGAVQVLFLDIPDHAAVDVTVGLARAEPALAGFAGLANAVLRGLIRDRAAILAASDPLRTDTPGWLAARWTAAYGEEAAAAIAAAHRAGAALDLSVKADAAGWAARLGGVLLPTGSLRLSVRGDLSRLPGYAEGSWWVQDTAASLPARLLEAGPGDRVADLCAAPGGKTAQLALTGAQVVAVDRSPERMRRLADNMARLQLPVETVVADVLTANLGTFDAVLLDAPCSATGTVRRHPDVVWTRREADIGRLAALQEQLLDRAAALLRPGGRLVFCTCSLEPEEGEEQARRFASRHPGFAALPVTAAAFPGAATFVTACGELRTLPHQMPPIGEAGSGLDGFFAARWLRRNGKSRHG